MNTLEKKLAIWIDGQISHLPDTINLVYLEYNISSKLEFSCSFFGFMFADSTPFDPEDVNHLDALSNYEWDSGISMFEFQIDTNDLGFNSESFDEMEILEKALSKSERLAKQIKEKGLTVVYGLHEATPKLFNLQSGLYKAKSRQKPSKVYYYELHFDYSGSHYIESYNLYGINEEPLLESDKIDQCSSNSRIALVLQDKAKLKDLLNFYRGWLVCSQKLVDIFKEYTSSIQVFPATLQRPLGGNGSELIEGYSVVNIYEKVDCIDPKWLVASLHKPAFDPGKGYKVLRDKVAGKDVFRIDVRDSRLLVSQRFRDEIERQKISGISWLKREVE